jgi:hypothetical protein
MMKWFMITAASAVLALLFGVGTSHAQDRPQGKEPAPRVGQTAPVKAAQPRSATLLQTGKTGVRNTALRRLSVGQALALARLRLGGAPVTLVSTDGVNVYLRARGLLYRQPRFGGPLVLCDGLDQLTIPGGQPLVNRLAVRPGPLGTTAGAVVNR